MDNVLSEVIKQVGSRRKLAIELGISHQSVVGWRRVPPTRAIEIEQLTGISRYRLRPDV